MRNEAAGFTGDSVESVSAAINRYAGQNGMEPVSVSICQEGAGSGAYFRGIAVFTPQFEEEEEGEEEASY